MTPRQSFLPITLLCACTMLGCTMNSTTPTTRPSNWSDQARNDPVNYDPTKNDWPSISGGSINNFDKNAFKRDLDHVLNP